MAKITYCDLCGRKIELKEGYLYSYKIRTSISAPFALNERIDTNIEIYIDVIPKQYDVCSRCRLEAVNNAVAHINSGYGLK
jgi:hypothetical protein